jgi:class 3 adenylate cyclase
VPIRSFDRSTPKNPEQVLQDAITDLQAQRAALGDALVNAAMAPLLERLAALNPQSQAAAASEPSRRLRQVSVLFIDLVGSTRLIQNLDPEEVQATVDGALAAFTAIVKQHGGEVLRYAGDNLKVAFGAHDTAGTREDDAERAVHCGLALLAEAARRGDDIKRRHGFEGFNARVGIHTGGVVRGGGVEKENSLSGLTVNIAARLEQAAVAGTLRISQDTWTLVRGLFDAQAQPPLAAKGVDAPITSGLVSGPKPRAFRLHARGIQGQETPLIGRQAELARFEATLDGLLGERTPRALTVIADAGLGKSRLLREFQHRLSSHPSSWWLIPARNQRSGALQPYGLLRDLLARRLEIADSDSADVAQQAGAGPGAVAWANQ